MPKNPDTGSQPQRDQPLSQAPGRSLVEMTLRILRVRWQSQRADAVEPGNTGGRRRQAS